MRIVIETSVMLQNDLESGDKITLKAIMQTRRYHKKELREIEKKIFTFEGHETLDDSIFLIVFSGN